MIGWVGGIHVGLGLGIRRVGGGLRRGRVGEGRAVGVGHGGGGREEMGVRVGGRGVRRVVRVVRVRHDGEAGERVAEDGGGGGVGKWEFETAGRGDGDSEER